MIRNSLSNIYPSNRLIAPVNDLYMKVMDMKKVRQLKLTFLLIILAILSLNGAAEAFKSSAIIENHKDTKPEGLIITIGTGRISDENIAYARRLAVEDALKRAVEYYLIKRLGSETVANNFHTIIKEIIPSYKDMIVNFTILTEEHLQEEIKLLIGARINEEIINIFLQRSGIVKEIGATVKVLFLVSELNASHGQIKCWWNKPDNQMNLYEVELALINEFQKRGLEPINRVMNTPEVEYTPEMLNTDLTPESIKRWGEVYLSDIVIYGKCNIDKGAGVSISLKAVDTRDASIICEDELSLPYLKEGEDPLFETIKSAISQMADKMVPLILSHVGMESKKLVKINVRLMNPESLRDLSEFIDGLEKRLNRVKSIKKIEINKESINFNIEYQGDEADFIRRIKEPDILPFDVSAVIEPGQGVVIRILR